ncbi:hypothetical protein Tco_0487548 [Tanacetum coccineum]
MNTRSSGQEPTTPYSERFIHQTKKKKKRRNPFMPIEDRAPKVKYQPFENLFEALIVYNQFSDLPFPMAEDQPMQGNNRAVAPTPGAAVIAVDLGDNFTVKDAIVVEGLTHRQSVTTSLWEAPKMKKPTMPMEVIEEKDTEETTTVGVQELGETANQEMKTETPNFER